MEEDNVDTENPRQVTQYIRKALSGDRFLARKTKVCKSGAVVCLPFIVTHFNSSSYLET